MLLKPPVRGQRINRSHPIASGLVGCWPMNDPSGKAPADVSGHGAHMVADTVGNEPAVAACGIGSALETSGADCNWTIDRAVSDQALTFLLWIQGTDTDGTMVSSGYAGGQPGLFIDIDTGGILDIALLADQYATLTLGANTATNGQLHCIAATWDGAICRGYLDGVEFDSATCTGTAQQGSNSVVVGAFSIAFDATQNSWSGKYANINEWNRALSPAEIHKLYIKPWALFEPFRVPVLVASGVDTTIACTLGTVEAVALQPTVNAETTVQATPVGEVVIEALAPTVTAETTIQVTPVGEVVITAIDPTLTVGNDTAISCGLGEVVIEALAPTINAETSLSITPIGEVVLSPISPIIQTGADTAISVTLEDVECLALTPNINAETYLNVPLGTVLIEAFECRVDDGRVVGSLMLSDITIRPSILGSIMINTKNRLWIGEDNNVNIDGLRLSRDGSYVNDATATFAILNSTGGVHASITGLTLAYSSGTDGDYVGVLPSTDADNLSEDSDYFVAITASSSDADLYRRQKVIAGYHGFEDV